MVKYLLSNNLFRIYFCRILIVGFLFVEHLKKIIFLLKMLLLFVFDRKLYVVYFFSFEYIFFERQVFFTFEQIKCLTKNIWKKYSKKIISPTNIKIKNIKERHYDGKLFNQLVVIFLVSIFNYCFRFVK